MRRRQEKREVKKIEAREREREEERGAHLWSAHLTVLLLLLELREQNASSPPFNDFRSMTCLKSIYAFLRWFMLDCVSRRSTQT